MTYTMSGTQQTSKQLKKHSSPQGLNAHEHAQRKEIGIFQTGNRLNDKVLNLINNSLSENSKSALLSDFRVFSKWTIKTPAIPATSEDIASFIADMSETRTVSTICRYISSLSTLHRFIGADNPTQNELVRRTLAGIKRKNHVSQKKAPALSSDDLSKILESLSKTEWVQRRNRSIFILGWCCGLRISELSRVKISDLEFGEVGIILTIPTSKTDQNGESYKIGIPNSPFVDELMSWVNSLKNLYKTNDGPLFPRFGCAQADRWFPTPGERPAMSIRGLSNCVKESMRRAGFSGSGHSLRRGIITESARLGVPEHTIQRLSRHSSIAILRGYVEAGNIFIDSPLPVIFNRLFGTS